MHSKWFIATSLSLIVGYAQAGVSTGKELLQRGDYAAAQEHLRPAALAGEAEAQFQFGRLYDNGWGLDHNEAEAVSWYRKSAGQGHPAAQNMLGMRHHAGRGVERNLEAALDYFRKSAAQSHAPGQYNLGLMYQFGWGVPKNEILAIEWFRKAAAQNEPSAFFLLGNAHENGIGTVKDDHAAVAWYRKGATVGDPASQNSLGVMYSAGRGGLARSVPDMIEWLRRSANQSYGTAMYNLGLIYEKGLGVPVDYAAAYLWFNLAAARLVAEAPEARARVEKLMSPDHVALAQRQSREYRPQTGAATSQLTGRSGTVKSGTGFFVSAAGELLTNHHVIDGCREILIQPGKLSARIVAKDARNDLALLATGTPSVRFAHLRGGKGVRRGDEIVVVGYPLRGTVASGVTITTGVVSALGGIGDDTSKLQISAPVQPGNSGGPLLDRNGLVVGIVHGKINALDLAQKTGDIPQNVNFAINLPTITGFLDAHNVDYVVSAANGKRTQGAVNASAIGQRLTRIVECHG